MLEIAHNLFPFCQLFVDHRSGRLESFGKLGQGSFHRPGNVGLFRQLGSNHLAQLIRPSSLSKQRQHVMSTRVERHAISNTMQRAQHKMPLVIIFRVPGKKEK